MQELILAANQRMQPIHRKWKLLTTLFATGSLEQEEVISMFVPEDRTFISRTVNYILPNITVLENSVVGQPPVWITEANAAGFEYSNSSPEELEDLASRSQIAKAVLSFFWDTENGTEEAGYAGRDMMRLGKGFLKCVWSSYREVIEKDEEQITQETLAMLQEEEDAALLEGRDMVSLSAIKSNVATEEEVQVENKPVISYVSPFAIRVPINARRTEDVEWIAERIIMRTDLAEDKEEYAAYLKDNKLVSSQNPFGEDVGGNPSQQKQSSTELEDFVEIWEFWDMINRKLYHFQLDAKEPLMEMDFPWSHREVPYAEFNNFKRDGNDYWGFGEIENVAGIQLLAGEILRAQVADIQRSGNKYFVNTAYLTAEVKEQLESNLPDVAIGINAGRNASIPEIVVPVPRSGAQPEVWDMTNRLASDLRTGMGMNDFQAGQSGADRMSATAVAAVDGNNSIRNVEKVRSQERGTSRAGQIILKLSQEFLDEPTVIRIGGSDAAKFLRVMPGDITGSFGVRVETDSTSSMNPAARAQRGAELIGLIPTIQTAMADPSLMPLVSMALRHMGFNPNALLPAAPAQAPGAPMGGPEQALAGPVPPEALQGLTGAPVQAPAPVTGDTGTGHPVQALAALGGPPVPAATLGDIAL